MRTNKWKMALLVWSAMFPFSTCINYGLSQLSFMSHWPLVARTFCLTCMLVPYMVFVALPFLTRRFRHWLQGQAEQGRGADQPAPIAPEVKAKVIPERYSLLVTNGARVR